MTWLQDRWALSYFGCQRRLTLAAGISTVTLVCHPQTWAQVESLVNIVPIGDALPVPVDMTTRPDGLAELALSGATLAVIMHTLRTAWVYNDGILLGDRKYSPPRRALARRVYLAMARTVEQVSSVHVDGNVPQIVIDDRVPNGGAS